MGRIYISRDRGAGAWAAAAWDRWEVDRGQPPPTVDEVVKWAQTQGYSWLQPGILCPVGKDSDGMEWYVCGFPGDPDIVIRAWQHLFALLDVNPRHWQIIKVSISAPWVNSWRKFYRSYGRLVKARGKG